MIKLTDEQRSQLDGAIVLFLRAQKSGQRAAKIQRSRPVLKALSVLPAGKSDMRYVDNALQRLRKDGRIKLVTAGWITA